MVEKLGWRVEGVARQRVRICDALMDHSVVALLAAEFCRLPEYEAPDAPMARRAGSGL